MDPPSIEEPIWMISANILLAVFLFLHLSVVPLFLYFRNEPVLRHRNLFLEFCYWASTLAQGVRFYVIIYYMDKGMPWATCPGIIWVTGVNAAAFSSAILMRCIRLYMIFYATKYKLENEIDEVENKQPNKRKLWQFWLDPKWLTTPYLMLGFFALLAFFQIFPLSATLVLLDDFGTLSRLACRSSIAPRAGAIASISTLVVLVVFIGWKLRHVHDGFFIKKELKYLALCGIFTIAPTFIWSLVHKTGWHPSIVSMISLTTVSFVVPIILAMQSAYQRKQTSSSSGTTPTDETTTDTANSSQVTGSRTIEMKQLDSKFKNHHKVAKFLRNNNGLPYLERYLLHFQEVDLSNALLLWSNIQKLTEINDETTLVAKAYLLLQKFIAPGSYIFVSCLTYDQRNFLTNTITTAMELMTNGPSASVAMEGASPAASKLTVETFADARNTLEDTLAEQLFAPFFKSEFYKEYQSKEVALGKGLGMLNN